MAGKHLLLYEHIWHFLGAVAYTEGGYPIRLLSKGQQLPHYDATDAVER
jgi:hypothetical protein